MTQDEGSPPRQSPEGIGPAEGKMSEKDEDEVECEAEDERVEDHDGVHHVRSMTQHITHRLTNRIGVTEFYRIVAPSIRAASPAFALPMIVRILRQLR